MGRHDPASSRGLTEVNPITASNDNLPAPREPSQPSPSGQAESHNLGGSSPHAVSRPALLVQVAGWALAELGVRDPSFELLEPIAVALSSLGAGASRDERAEMGGAGAAPKMPRRNR
jgi:hypothetical protein